MSKVKGLNETAWEQIFDKYDVISKVAEEEAFYISASKIKEFREPRLMAKFDHSINLPDVFADNNLSILPITRGDYAIGHFDTYHAFEGTLTEITKVSFPDYIESLDYNNISSEAIALNCALASGIIQDFMDDEEVVPTVSGRMGSGSFGFLINNSLKNSQYKLEVTNSQIEIDAAYEGLNSLAIVEAKRDISEDFLVRQLYYPYRVWQSKISKPVRPIFLVYSNGVYRLYEYQFDVTGEYNSLRLVKQRNYSVEDMSISIEDIQSVLNTVELVKEPELPFPQADSFDRVVNICELLNGQELSRADVTEQYAFDVRQTNYYTDAARYLGLVSKDRPNNSPVYNLTPAGKELFSTNYKKRQLLFCEAVLSHKVFNDSLKMYLNTGTMPSRDDVVKIMKTASLYRVDSEETFRRRASTVRGWLNWIVSRINE